MSLSLDYIGKLAIVLIVTATIVGIMFSLESDITTLPMIDNLDESSDVEENLVEVSGPEQLANFVDICASQTSDSLSDETCFIVRHESSSFNITDPESEIGNSMETDIEDVDFQNDYNRELVTISYRISDDTIVVEE